MSYYEQMYDLLKCFIRHVINSLLPFILEKHISHNSLEVTKDFWAFRFKNMVNSLPH